MSVSKTGDNDNIKPKLINRQEKPHGETEGRESRGRWRIRASAYRAPWSRKTGQVQVGLGGTRFLLLDPRITVPNRKFEDGLLGFWALKNFHGRPALNEAMQEYFISGFNVLLPTLIAKLDIPKASAV